MKQDKVDKFLGCLTDYSDRGKLLTHNYDWGVEFNLSSEVKNAAQISGSIEFENRWIDICFGECSIEWDLKESDSDVRIKELLRIIDAVINGKYCEKTWYWKNFRMQIQGEATIDNGLPITFGRTNIFFYFFEKWCVTTKKCYSKF